MVEWMDGWMFTEIFDESVGKMGLCGLFEKRGKPKRLRKTHVNVESPQ